MATIVYGYDELIARRAIHSSVSYLFERCFDSTRIHPYLQFLGDWQTIGARPSLCFALIVLYPFFIFVYLSFCIDIPKQAKSNQNSTATCT